MNLDDPDKPEFAHWDSYSRFARHVRSSNRYVWGKEVDAFLQTVRATIKNRDGELIQGQELYRAQRGVAWVKKTDEDGTLLAELSGFDSTRMKPLTDRAKEGRANPAGIPVLYVGNSIETAISEVRPWIGAEVSVAACKVMRSLKTLDLSVEYGEVQMEGLAFMRMTKEDFTAAEKEEAVWIEIDNAFSIPVTLSDDQAEYVPTQILAELFRSIGYDAIGYKSHFGDKGKKEGFNIAIFDPDAVEIVSCAPYQVKSIKVEAEQIGHAWYLREED